MVLRRIGPFHYYELQRARRKRLYSSGRRCFAAVENRRGSAMDKESESQRENEARHQRELERTFSGKAEGIVTEKETFAALMTSMRLAGRYRCPSAAMVSAALASLHLLPAASEEEAKETSHLSNRL
jgi:hypothetical protein